MKLLLASTTETSKNKTTKTSNRVPMCAPMISKRIQFPGPPKCLFSTKWWAQRSRKGRSGSERMQSCHELKRVCRLEWLSMKRWKERLSNGEKSSGIKLNRSGSRLRKRSQFPTFRSFRNSSNRNFKLKSKCSFPLNLKVQNSKLLKRMWSFGNI